MRRQTEATALVGVYQPFGSTTGFLLVLTELNFECATPTKENVQKSLGRNPASCVRFVALSKKKNETNDRTSLHREDT